MSKPEYLKPLKPTLDYFLLQVKENKDNTVVELVNTDYRIVSFDNVTKLPFNNPDFSIFSKENTKNVAIFIRYFLERSVDPQALFEKITRLFEHGYIETSSPVIELIRGIETDIVDEYRGLYETRYIVWTEEEDNSLHLLPKYGILQLAPLAEDFEKELYEFLNSPIYWNNYYSWNKDNPPKLVVHTFGKDFDWHSYGNLLAKAVLHNTKKTNSFFLKLDKVLNNKE